MKYKVADLVFEMFPDEITKKQSDKYIYDGPQGALFSLKAKTLDDFKTRKKQDNLSFPIYLYLMLGVDFYKKLLEYDGIFIHSSAIVVDDKAYLFSAPSGTGKSTHTNLWLQLFGDRAYILNDDKPAIRVLEDGIYAYGTPWSGKHDISANKKVKLQGICFLERDTTDWIKPASELESCLRLLEGTLKKLSSEDKSKLLDIIKTITSKVNVWKMGCTPTTNAAKVAYESMSGEKFCDLRGTFI